MARASLRIFALQATAAVLVGGLIGGFLGIASAQDTRSGWLNTDCAGRCTAAGYEAGFCQHVCWVPDPAAAAETDRLDWPCFEGCTQRGGKTQTCLASCRR